MTSDDLNKALAAIRNQLIKKRWWKKVRRGFFFIKYFRHSFLDAILVVCPDILCGSCGSILLPASVRGCNTIILFVQLPVRNDLWWFGQNTARITQPTCQIKMAQKLGFLFLKYFQHSLFQRNYYGMPGHYAWGWGWILVCATVRGCPFVIPLYNYLLEYTSEDLDKAYVCSKT